MRPLNAVDYTFALLDKRQPMYVAALCVFDGDEVQARTAFAHLSAPILLSPLLTKFVKVCILLMWLSSHRRIFF